MSNHPVETVNTSRDKLKIVTAICLAIAGIAGFYILSDKSMAVRVGALLGALLCSMAIVLTSNTGREFLGFAKEAVRETKKVVWPTRKEAVQITAIVFGFVLVMAVFLWGVDKLLEFVLYDLILGWKK